eukprot:5247817-Pyramimonas_sp.AAC.1
MPRMRGEDDELTGEDNEFTDGAVVWSSEDAQRASTPTTDREPRWNRGVKRRGIDECFSRVV